MKIFVIGGVSISDGGDALTRQRLLIANSMQRLGRDIVSRNHDLLVCSPFEESADVDAVRGAASSLHRQALSAVEFHAPDEPSVRHEIDSLVASLSLTRLRRHLYPLSTDEGKIQWLYSWLVAQISAMECCHAMIALGGKPTGSASLLLALAENRRKRILPLTFAEGVAAKLFQRRRYELEDRLSDRIAAVHDPNRIGETVQLLEELAVDKLSSSQLPSETRVFISYPRARPEEADFVEMTLRRRNYNVFRDERDFSAGQQVHAEIVEHIHRSTIFIVLWCREYACSPWCFDEFELALERHKAKKLILWILLVDDTRIVPPAARDLLSYPASSREELQACLLTLMEGLQAPQSRN